MPITARCQLLSLMRAPLSEFAERARVNGAYKCTLVCILTGEHVCVCVCMLYACGAIFFFNFFFRLEVFFDGV